MDESHLRTIAAQARRATGAHVSLSVPGVHARGSASVVWSEGGVTWRGYGEAARCEGVDLAAVSPAARAALAGVTPLGDEGPAARMFGGQRFDPDDPRHDDDPAWASTPSAQLVLPAWSVVDDGARPTTVAVIPRDVAADPEALARWWRDAPTGDARDDAPTQAAVDDEPVTVRASRWSALVRDALRAMEGAAVRKLVGARRVRVRADAPWSVSAALERMSPRATRFSVTLGPVRFVGATPERLVLRRGAHVEADALAGSVPRHGDDDALSHALLHSEKDLREHALVVGALRDALAPWCDALAVPDAPAIKRLPTLLHLHSPIAGTLRAPAADVAALASALHPTPAVGGTPRALAVPWLRAHEDAPRGWYAGPVGWCDARGDGAFCVALRSAVLREGHAWLYAGAGLVAGSDPAREWDETEAKLAPMREALGVE